MFIPRGESDWCSPSDSCSTSSPSTSVPSPSDSHPNLDSSLMDNPGTRRYIGIGMVLGILFIIFLVWLWRGKWPRRMFHQHCGCCSRRSKQIPTSTDHTRGESPIPSMSSEKDALEKGFVKEMSGGVVVFTPIPKALGKKDRCPLEWEVEHVNDIRRETRTPQRHNDSRQS